MKYLIYLFPVLILLLCIEHEYLYILVNSLIGKLLILLFIIFYSYKNKFSGLLVAFIFICLIELARDKQREYFSLLGGPSHSDQVKAENIAAEDKKKAAKQAAEDKVAEEKNKKTADLEEAKLKKKSEKQEAQFKQEWSPSGRRKKWADMKLAAKEQADAAKEESVYIHNKYSEYEADDYKIDLDAAIQKQAASVAKKQATAKTMIIT